MVTALALSWCVVQDRDSPIWDIRDPINTISVATPSSPNSPILTNNVINTIDTQHNHFLMSFTFTPHDHTHDAQREEKLSQFPLADVQLFSKTLHLQNNLIYLLSSGEGARGSVGEAPYLDATDHTEWSLEATR